MNQLRQATALARGKKVKKVVDTRASKGRKIRYHVHEKIQNFMIPIEAGASRQLALLRLISDLASFGQLPGTTSKPTSFSPASSDAHSLKQRTASMHRRLHSTLRSTTSRTSSLARSRLGTCGCLGSLAASADALLCKRRSSTLHCPYESLKRCSRPLPARAIPRPLSLHLPRFIRQLWPA